MQTPTSLWRHRNPLFLILGLLGVFASACLGPVADGIQTRDRKLIIGDEQWDLIYKFEQDDQFKIGARYGRAVARLELKVPGGESKRCTGWMIDDEILVTAHHCRPEKQNSLNAAFGEYGEVPEDYALGTKEARLRLIDLGVPASHIDAFPGTDFAFQFQNWGCTFEQSEYTSQLNYSDVDYWRCAPRVNTFQLTVVQEPISGPKTLTSGVTVSTTMRMLPGHVWGYFNVAPGPRPKESRHYAVSHNRHSQYPQTSHLLSPYGRITSSCSSISFKGNTYKHCFRMRSIDWLKGSSGGVIVDPTTHRAFGVISGHIDGWQINYNVGAYISDLALRYATMPAKTITLSSTLSMVDYFGGPGGKDHFLTCPAHYMAIGLVTSTADSGHVGNFGLVCLPAHATDTQLDRAVVIAGGSSDTTAGPVNQKDFNTYLTEVYTKNAAGDERRQALTLCPAGFYFSGFQGRAGTYINQLLNIRCSRWEIQAYSHYYRQPREAIGSIGTGAIQSIECPRGTAAAAMRIRSASLTDGVQLFCKHLP